MLKINENGTMAELTAHGATSFNAEQTAEALALLDVVRRDGGGPSTVREWLLASEQPRALESTLTQEMRARGFDFGCPQCFGAVDAARYSARRRSGVTASLDEHLLHARNRRRPLPPGSVQKHGGLPAPGAILDDDERKVEPDYLGE